jgi:hypothetical protein
MAKRKPTPSNAFQQPQMDPHCVECCEMTPYLFKGVRYCADHHPDPGPHIAPKRRAA